jgi:hypothetical protein
MRVGLLDVDGHNFPNLALMKVSAYHKSIGDEVEFVNFLQSYDRVYKSKIFDFTPDIHTHIMCGDIVKGGSGYDLEIKLPREVEDCDPDYSIYPWCDYSIQLFTRGCIRSCKFCIVPKKEGLLRSVKPMKLNPNGTYIQVLDNNFFAHRGWQYHVNWLIETKQRVVLHGVDVRILTEPQMMALNKLKHYKQIKIAWDNPKDDLEPKLRRLIGFVKPYKLMCYVLIGFNSTREEDLYRIEALRSLKIDPFVMPFDKTVDYQRKFARWVNHKAIFKTVNWHDYKPNTTKTGA